MKKYISTTLLIFVSSAVFAKIQMPAIFGDNMMFQQGKSLNIWGKADAGSTVKAMFNSFSKTVKTDDNGNWEISLPAQKASFSPAKLTVFENGKLEKEFSNILVGEIWIAGGQSNMEWKVKSSTDSAKAKENAKKLAGKMRYFLQSSNGYSKVPKTEFQKGAKWIIVDDSNVGNTTAVGFYFAERLLADLNVPVAIIYASKGAASMATWTDKETLMSGWTKNHKPYVDILKTLETYDDAAYQKAKKAHQEKLAKHNAAVAKAKKEGKKPPSVAWDFRYAPSPESPIQDFRTPAIHFNGKIAPMRNFSVRGVIWYQGESDAASEVLLEHYTESFGMLIDSWRKSLEDENLPFLQVQLASYKRAKNWAPAREAQYQNTLLFKNVYMSQTIDSGEEYDIHPKDKTIVGSRLEKIALEKIYKVSNVKSDAPVAKSVKYSGNKAIVSFDGKGSSIVCKGEARGFEVLTDGKWNPANAEFVKGKVVVKSTDNKTIDGVRYLWKNWTLPEACIYGSNDMPAIPFEKLRNN